MVDEEEEARLLAAPDVARRLAAHWLFGLLFVVGAALRLVVSRAYQPALLYYDSTEYLVKAVTLDPSGPRPIGYSIFLRPFVALGDLRLIPLVQHLLGLGLAVGIYMLLLRAGVRRWIAALAAAPVLLDAYQLQIEQNVLAETLFSVMLFVGVVLLVDGAGRHTTFGRRLATAAAAGLVLGMAVPVRLIGQFVVIAGVAYLLLTVRRAWGHRLITAGVFALVFALPVLTTMAYNRAWTGSSSLSPIGGRMLYARAAVLVDCDRIEIPANRRDLCPPQPLGQRRKVDNYVWNVDSPANLHTVPPGMTRDQSLRSFAMLVFRQQPLDVTRAILIDMGKNFWPTKAQFYNDVDVARWHFQDAYPDFNGNLETIAAFGAEPEVDLPLARLLISYQRFGYTPGTLLGIALLVGLLAGAGVGRARHSPLRSACLAWTFVGATVVLLPAVYEFSWRYMLPGLVTLPVAGGLGLTALMDMVSMKIPPAEPQPPAMQEADADDAAVTGS